MDQSRGPGFLSGGSDAILQNMMDVWGRHASSGAAVTPVESSGERSAEQSKEHSESTTAAQEEEDMCFVYPVLQPVLGRRARDGRGGGSLPWSGEESRTFLRFSVFFANPFNSLMDALQGQVLVPLSALAVKEEEGGVQPELRGWFDVSPVDDKFVSQATTTVAAAAAAAAPPPSPAHSSEPFSSGVDDGRNARNGTNNTGSSSSKHVPDGRITDSYDSNGGGRGMGALFLRLQLTLPDGKAAAAGGGTEEDKEASLALQTLLG
ncbi:unnamed protein product, partial [Ectocarpus sp. 12 AP-2014]